MLFVARSSLSRPPLAKLPHKLLRENGCNQNSKAGNIIFTTLDFNSAGSLPIAANPDSRNCPLTSVKRTVKRFSNEPEKQSLNACKSRPVWLPKTLAHYNRSIASSAQLTHSNYPQYATSCGRMLRYLFRPAGARDAGAGSELTFSFNLGVSLALPRPVRSASRPN